MLETPAPFPQVGSYALLVQTGTELVRIIQAGPAAGEVMISRVGRDGASGNRTLPLEELQDGTPLDSAEQVELRTLEREFLTRTAPVRSAAMRARFNRHNALRRRRIYAEVMRLALVKAGLPADVPHPSAHQLRDAA